ncbi:hypothetical protein [Desulfolucanica intricata]|uniref:hypothetical protein n=1 Tax=Desulfolucanica intricata TaxID=1285191 RepID=UPI00083500BB|nr:hypothetical protein [Desulfolucanica intricata]
MLFGKLTAGIRMIRNIRQIIFLPLVIAIIITISACTASKGSIVILENPNGKGFTMDFKEWSSKNKCELSLNKGDVLQFEVVREDGEIALIVSGKNGSEPYTGNDLRSGIFTVTVSESDKYDIRITGKDATGKVTVKNVGSSAE